jgi:flagellar biosynthetic protein FliQ
MTSPEVIDVARDGIVTFLKVGGPLLMVALLVGVVISLLQALTQIQEQTLVFVPKILALAGAALFAMPFMGDALASYMTRIAERIVSGGGG